MVPVHPVLGDLGGEPRAQPVVGVGSRVLVRLELTKFTAIIMLKLYLINQHHPPVASFEHRVVGFLCVPRSVERLFMGRAVSRQLAQPLGQIPLILISLQCEVFLSYQPALL